VELLEPAARHLQFALHPQDFAASVDFLQKLGEGRSLAGLPDFSRSKHAKTGKNITLCRLYKMTVNYTK
jgi:hypothetical protein